MADDGDIVLFRASKPKRKKQKVEEGSKQSKLLKQDEKQAPSQQQEQPKQQEAVDEAVAPGPGPSSEAAERAETFKELGLSDWLCSVCKSLGMSRPTHVQDGCIPAILQGKDVIGLAQTGSGKTAAFALPILQRLAKDPYGVYAVVLTPTRWAMSLAWNLIPCWTPD